MCGPFPWLLVSVPLPQHGAVVSPRLSFARVQQPSSPPISYWSIRDSEEEASNVIFKLLTMTQWWGEEKILSPYTDLQEGLKTEWLKDKVTVLSCLNVEKRGYSIFQYRHLWVKFTVMFRIYADRLLCLMAWCCLCTLKVQEWGGCKWLKKWQSEAE